MFDTNMLKYFSYLYCRNLPYSPKVLIVLEPSTAQAPTLTDLVEAAPVPMALSGTDSALFYFIVHINMLIISLFHVILFL